VAVRAMTDFYFYLVLLNAAVAFVAAAGVWWKNRFQIIGPLFGATFLFLGAWLVGFAQYFRAMPDGAKLTWAHITLTLSIINHPFYFHAICVLAERTKRLRWWIVASYATGALFLGLLWGGQVIAGLRSIPYMNHYVRYNPATYPLLGAYILFWAVFGFGVLVQSLRQSAGYKKTQIVYFFVAAFIVFLTTDSIILPLEYNVNIQPFGFFVLPFNLGFLAYVLVKARLADFNVVIARVLLYAVTMLVVAGLSLLAVGAVTLVAPTFLGPPQVLFSLLLSALIGGVLMISLPRTDVLDPVWVSRRAGRSRQGTRPSRQPRRTVPARRDHGAFADATFPGARAPARPVVRRLPAPSGERIAGRRDDRRPRHGRRFAGDPLAARPQRRVGAR
jgi:hypothetical protein